MKKSQRIQRLNDAVRSTFQGGRVVMTAGVNALPEDTKNMVIFTVRTFSDFAEDNDPHGEHDFGSFEVNGDKSLSVVTHVLTIMLAEEY